MFHFSDMNNFLSEFVLKSLKIRYIFEVHVYVFTLIANSKWYIVNSMDSARRSRFCWWYSPFIPYTQTNARLDQHNYRSIITNRSESKQEQNQGFTWQHTPDRTYYTGWRILGRCDQFYISRICGWSKRGQRPGCESQDPKSQSSLYYAQKHLQ